MRRLGDITLVPVGLAQPVAELDRASVLVRLDPAAAEEGAVIGFRNGIDALANRAGACASHEISGVRNRVRVRHAGDHVGDVGVVGKMGKGVDVVFVRGSHDEPRRQQDRAIGPRPFRPQPFLGRP